MWGLQRVPIKPSSKATCDAACANAPKVDDVDESVPSIISGLFGGFPSSQCLPELKLKVRLDGFHTRRPPSPTTAIILTHPLNPFRDSLRSPQLDTTFDLASLTTVRHIAKLALLCQPFRFGVCSCGLNKIIDSAEADGGVEEFDIRFRLWWAGGGRGYYITRLVPDSTLDFGGLHREASLEAHALVFLFPDSANKL